MEKVMVGKSQAGVSPAVIAGALVNGKPNYITLGSYGGVSRMPPTIYVSINKTHYTNAGIKENGYFSVNWPAKDMLEKTEYVGRVSGKDTDKSKVFSPFYGSVAKAPMIEECPVNILCKLVDTLDLERNEVFIGEIVETYVAKEFVTDGRPDLAKAGLLLLAGGGYYELGDLVKSTTRR